MLNVILFIALFVVVCVVSFFGGRVIGLLIGTAYLRARHAIKVPNFTSTEATGAIGDFLTDYMRTHDVKTYKLSDLDSWDIPEESETECFAAEIAALCEANGIE